jgi:hypothetical protein
MPPRVPQTEGVTEKRRMVGPAMVDRALSTAVARLKRVRSDLDGAVALLEEAAQASPKQESRRCNERSKVSQALVRA